MIDIKTIFTNKLGLLFVLINFLLVIWGLYEKEWNYGLFHYYYEPIPIKIILFLNLPAMLLAGIISNVFFNQAESHSNSVTIDGNFMILIVACSIFQWMIVGYFISRIFKLFDSKQIH